MAATLTDPTTTHDAATETTSGAPDYSRFDWMDHWYPVAWTRDLPVDAVTKVTLFDVDYCVVNRGEREPLALEDKCPHRLAALSEGRLTAQGYVQCAYHGWSFDTTGDCKSTIRSAASTALCATAVPCRVEQGLLWLFPGAAAGRDPESVAPPRVPILGAAVYTGVFVAVVSNGSYQILQGLVERGWWGDRRALLFVGRAGRSLMASALAIRGMQMSGLQAVTVAPPPR